MKEILQVKGMTCGNCVKKVHKIISRFEGVSDVSVDLQRMEAAFECDPHHTDVADIVKAIDDFGFTASKKV